MSKVSIIVPVYNTEQYLKRCIDSILSQTFKDFELILINDGSTDKSLEIMQEYKKKDSRIKILSQPNQGPAITRNIGINKAKSEYLMFIDSDDYIDNNYIEAYYNNIYNEDLDVVIGGYKRIVGEKVEFTLKLKQGEFSKYIVTGPVCRIIRKQFLLDNNIQFLNTNSSEDVYFNLMIYNKSSKIKIIDNVGYNYFYNSNSISNTSHKGFKKDIKIIELLNLINVEKSYNKELNQYYIIRYIIWYLLYSGKTATSEDFIKEYNKLFSWLEDNIPNYKKNKYLSLFKLKEEPIKYRIIINTFMLISKINLIKLFSKLYCKGNNLDNIHTFVVLAYNESEFLEDCIKSVLNQSVKSRVLIATTTDNKYIREIGKKYHLDVVVGKHTTIGGDFDFAKSTSNSKIVTIAHQDDIYEPSYAENIIKEYHKHKDTLIIFTDYYEIRDENKVYTNKNLKIKRILLLPLKLRIFSGTKLFKRIILKFGCPICCPSVAFVNENCPSKVFTSNFKSNCDWYGWEKLSKEKGKFIYISKKLVGHRVDETSTTTDTINSGIRTKEDLEMLKKFWPEKIAKMINKFYKNAECSNRTKN